MEAKEVMTVEDAIYAHIKADDRDLVWLAKYTEIPYSTLYSIFVQKTFSLNQKKLDTINEFLGTDFKKG